MVGRDSIRSGIMIMRKCRSVKGETGTWHEANDRSCDVNHIRINGAHENDMVIVHSRSFSLSAIYKICMVFAGYKCASIRVMSMATDSRGYHAECRYSNKDTIQDSGL